MKNCTGINCIMQHDRVNPATCTAVMYCPHATPPITNADRIRAMTDEELLKMIYTIGAQLYNKTTEEWLEWLKKEPESEGEDGIHTESETE